MALNDSQVLAETRPLPHANTPSLPAPLRHYLQHATELRLLSLMDALLFKELRPARPPPRRETRKLATAEKVSDVWKSDGAKLPRKERSIVLELTDCVEAAI
jgi:hypothetical protein